MAQPLSGSFDELLKRLSEVKRLPQPAQPYRTTQANVGSQLRDTTRSALAGTPRLADEIARIQQGGSAQTGPKGALASVVNSAPAKALFGGLTIIDTPRRAIISGIKEVKDALDDDPNTKFSGGDFVSQVKDPTFGFGRVAPGAGWGGRLIGFIGDVVLDPLTYATFGASVPLKSGAAASRLLAQGAPKTLFRKSVSISGREGRFALARAARQMGATDDIVKNVAARGKSALTPELASKLGVRQNGLYMFGSRVRIKGTGRIGSYMEQGIIGSRLGITKTRVGKKLQYLYTPRGPAAIGDLSSWRADLASGRLAPARVNMIMSALNGAEDARTLGSTAYGDELRRLSGMFENEPRLATFANDLHRYIEKPAETVLDSDQLAAKQVVETYLDDVAKRIELVMGEIEPGWSFNRIERYVPHILTDKARRAIDARSNTPWAQKLEAYLSTDVLDMKNNLQSRHIKANMDDFLGSGRKLEDGSIDGINKMFREVTGENYDLFETDMRKILGGYADTVRSAAEVTALMRNLRDDDFVRILKETGHVDEDFQRILKTRIDENLEIVTKGNDKLSEQVKKARKQLEEVAGAKGSVAKRLVAKEKELLGEIDDLTDNAAKATLSAEKLEPLLLEMENTVALQRAAAEEVGQMIPGGNAATALVKEQVMKFQVTVDSLRELLFSGSGIGQGGARLGAFVAEKRLALSADILQTLDLELKQLDTQIVSNQKFLEALQRYGDSLGPEMERIYKAFRSDSLDAETGVVRFGRMSSSDVGEFIETDQRFNKVIDAVSNPFDTNFLAEAGGEAVGTKGLGDSWVQTVVSTEGTPEYELLQSIPDFGATGSKAQRVSMGSVRDDARSMTLVEAREAVVRAAVLGDNLEESADAFYFLTLREMRASELISATDDASRARARAAYAQELLTGNSERAKSWRTARDQVRQLAKVKEQYDVLASQKSQLGTTTVGGETVYLSEEGRELIPNLRKELDELETTPDDPVLRDAYSSALRELDQLIAGTGDALITVSRASQELQRFFDFAAVGGVLRGGAGADTSVRNSKAVYELVGGFTDANFNIVMQNVLDAKTALQSFVKEYATDPAKIQMKRASLQQALDDPLIAQAQFVSQKHALAERTVVASTKDVGEVLTNYSVYHNARIAVDYVHRLLPEGVEISDSLLRFSFAGSAKQHEQYVRTMQDARNWVDSHWSMIEAERANIPASEQAGWLQERIKQKLVYDATAETTKKEKLEPLTIDELVKLGQVMGDLSLVTRKVPRDIQAWRPNQVQWSSHLKKVLDVVDPGWDNSMTKEISDAVGAEARGPSRVGYEMGQGVKAGARATQKDLGALSDKTSREMQGAFKIQSEVNNTISNKRKTAPKTLIELIEAKYESGGMSRDVADQLIADTRALDDALKAEFKTFKNQVKEETGYSVSQLNKLTKTLKQSPGDSVGMANLWANATKTRGDGGTRSLRAIDDFFAYLRGGREVLVTKGGKGSAGGTTETFQVDLADDLFSDENVAAAVGATSRDYRADGRARTATTRTMEITDEIEKSGVKDADTQLKKIYSEAKTVRKNGVERMAYIAAQLGLGDNDDIVRVIQRGVDADDRMRALRLRVKSANGKEKEALEEIVEEHKLVVRGVQREFDDFVRATVTGGVTRGGISPDIMKHISFGDSHLGKMRNSLERKIASFQELVFSPDAGLANVDSLRFGVDDLGTDKMSLVRVRYLRGLADDYRNALEGYEEAQKAAAKVRPGSKAKKQVVEDFETFKEVYGDEKKFGQLVRWIEETQKAIDEGYELPVKPFGLKVPKRVEKNIRAIKRAKETVTDLTQSPDFNSARDAQEFYEFLRLLSTLNIEPTYFEEVSRISAVRYGSIEERQLRNQLAALSGGQGDSQLSVVKMERVDFDGKLREAFLNSSDDIKNLNVMVRTENGYDEVIDSPRAVIDYVRAQQGQKFSYSVSTTQDSAGRTQVTFTDANGPEGSRGSYTYYQDDYSFSDLNPGADSARGGGGAGAVGIGNKQGPQIVSRATGVSETVLDSPIYAWYGAQGALPSSAPTNVVRHYNALASGQQTSVARYSEFGPDGAARKIIIGGNAENKSKTAVDNDDFFEMVNPEETYAIYDVPSRGHRIVERFDRSGFQMRQAESLRPEELFFGLDNERLSAAFARETIPGSRTTNTLISQLTALDKKKVELRKAFDDAQYNNSLRQQKLVELDEVETEMASIRKKLNDGTPQSRMAARAAAYVLFEKFRQPSVAGFILGRSFQSVDDSADAALDAFKKYAGQLREKKIIRTLDDGGKEEFFPFQPDLGVADRRKTNLSESWKKSEDKKTIDKYENLNKVINAASKDLDVVKTGGDAADLAARYASVLEQLRNAERKLILDKGNVATEFYRTVDESTISSLRRIADDAGDSLAAARATRKSAQDSLRSANQVFIPDAPLREARSRLTRLVERGGDAMEVNNLRSQVQLLEAQIAQASSQRTQAVGAAEEALRKADTDLLEKNAALKQANLELREANEQANVGRRRALEALEQDALDPEKGPMTADKFDEFVAKEIEAFKQGIPSDFSVSVSTESIDRVAAETAELSARRESLALLHPGLQTRYEGARVLYEQAEKRYKDLQDQFDKASKTLANIERAEAGSGALAFGGKNYPAEYAAAKAQQVEARKRVAAAQKRLDELTSQVVKLTAEVNASRSATAELETLALKKEQAVGRLSLLRNALDTIRKETPDGYPSWVKGVLKKDWDAEFEDVSDELNSVFQTLNSLPDDMRGKDLDRLWASWTKVLESRASVLLSKDDWAYAVQLERRGAAGLLDSDNLVWKNLPDAGFVKLEGKGGAKGFENLQMRPEVAEILGNMARIRDPQFVRSMRRFMTPYTRFFKAWALATPGFHVRNSITNGFGMIAAGGNPVYLYRAAVEYNAMHKFLRQGKTIQQYLDTITDSQRKKLVADSYNAMAGSGVGQSEELLFDSGGKLANNRVTRASRRAGIWIENHSRFMLAYDGLKQGLDVQMSTARVRKFLFDYEDTSRLDAYMRQIIPFWTWTSRNIPLTVTNIYMNPRPYQIYQSFKRNVQDDEKTNALPLYMREAGGFALAGTGLAATPELGFNRLQADVSMLSDPTRIAANVNPLLRVPVETMLANKSFFRNREFNSTPIEAEGPVGTLASLLGQPIGMGQSVGSKRFVNEKLMYGLTNMNPVLNQVERFLPSQEYYKQRGTTNPFLGFIGSPVKELTPQMLTSEQRRRIAELKKLLESQPKVRP